MTSFPERLRQAVVLGDGGYLIELERRGYVNSGSDNEQVGTGKGSGEFTPQVAIENPAALRELHQEFFNAGSQVLQALTFFGTREKLNRAGYGAQTEAINAAAVRLAKEVAGDKAFVAGSISRTQLVERGEPDALKKSRDHIAEQVTLLKDAGVELLILETFFHLAEMKVAIECAIQSKLPVVATMSFRPLASACSDGYSPAECARVMAALGADAVGANCEQEPERMLPLLREMRDAVDVPIAAQPAAFRTTHDCHSFTRQPAFPDDLETIQVSRREFVQFGAIAEREGIRFVGGCCGCNAAYIRSLARGLSTAQ
jgi:betaine-homocysteine S-methyltransferase